MHRLIIITKMVIHFGVHKHLMVDGKCREYVNKISRLIIEEVNHTLDAKIHAILWGVNKTFLATHLLDDSGDGTTELMNDE